MFFCLFYLWLFRCQLFEWFEITRDILWPNEHIIINEILALAHFVDRFYQLVRSNMACIVGSHSYFDRLK